MQVESKPGYFSVELEGKSAHAYNESAFGHFLAIERKRSERSTRPFALLLVSRRVDGDSRRIDTETATRLFTALSLCFRETDFVGWYREGTVAGAVLTHLGGVSGTDATHQVRRRINQLVSQALLPDFSELFSIRIYQLPGQELELAEDWS